MGETALCTKVQLRGTVPASMPQQQTGLKPQCVNMQEWSLVTGGTCRTCQSCILRYKRRGTP
jgi:hypothetical protein